MALLYSQSLFNEQHLEVFNANASATIGLVHVMGDNFHALPNVGKSAHFGSLEAALDYFEKLEKIGAGTSQVAQMAGGPMQASLF